MGDDCVDATVETPEKTIRFAYWNGEYVGWYNPLLDHVLEP